MAMIIRYRNNMNLLRTTRFGKTRNKFRDAKKAYIRAASGKLELKKATPEQLRAIRKKLRTQKGNNRIVFIGLLIIFVPIISFGIYNMISSANRDNLRIIKADAALKKSNSEKVSSYLNTGDSLYMLNDWRGAYYAYFQAGNIQPNKYDIAYRLALAKTGECVHKRIGCKEAEERLKVLIEIFPDSAALYRLRISKATALGDTASASRDFEHLDRLE